MGLGVVDVGEMLSEVKRVAGADEACAVFTFEIVRPRGDGGAPRTLRVEVYDSGPDAGGQRYAVAAMDAKDHAFDGSFTLGNPASGIREALNGVHWRRFD